MWMKVTVEAVVIYRFFAGSQVQVLCRLRISSFSRGKTTFCRHWMTPKNPVPRGCLTYGQRKWGGPLQTEMSYCVPYFWLSKKTTCCLFPKRDSSVWFLSSGLIHQSTPFGLLLTFLNFFRILFRIRRVIRIRNSYCAMAHCGKPNFFGRYQGFKTWVM